MPNPTSYALFPLANHRVLSTTTLLSTPSRWLSLHCTDKTLGSYSMFQLRSNTMSSRDEVTEFRQQEFTAILCLHGFFCIMFCSFLLPLLQQQQHIRISCNDHEKLKLNHHYLKELTQRLQPTDGIYQTDSITYLTPSALHVMSAA